MLLTARSTLKIRSVNKKICASILNSLITMQLRTISKCSENYVSNTYIRLYSVNSCTALKHVMSKCNCVNVIDHLNQECNLKYIEQGTKHPEITFLVPWNRHNYTTMDNHDKLSLGSNRHFFLLPICFRHNYLLAKTWNWYSRNVYMY